MIPLASFNFFGMAGNYEERKVDNFQKGKLVVDTCLVIDADQPYETGIAHPRYNKGDWVIVELYDSKEKAQKGHERWVKTMTSNPLPEELKDVSSAMIAKLVFAPDEGKRVKEKSKKGDYRMKKTKKKLGGKNEI
jgi:hypothetical protein